MNKQMSSVLSQGDQTPVVLKGTQEFRGKEIPVMVGGFGEDNKVVTDKMVSEIHNSEAKEIRKTINRNINRFKDGVDIIYLKKDGNQITDNLSDFGYSKMEISKSENIYILSERGYSKLIKIMDTDLAWEIHDKLIDDYFLMKEQNTLQGISLELQAIILQDKKIQQVENKVNNLEDNIHITRSQQKQLNDFVRTVVINALGGKYSLAYKEFGKKAFSECWKDYKNAFNIVSYLDTPKKDFQAAINFINAWKPGRELDLLIRGSNMEAQNIG